MPKINFLVPTRDNPKIYNLTPFESLHAHTNPSHQAMPQSRAAIDAPYGYMRCTQLTIHLKPKHREPEGDLIAGLIGGISASRTVKWNK